jgi:hypothetical protein
MFSIQAALAIPVSIKRRFMRIAHRQFGKMDPEELHVVVRVMIDLICNIST